VNNSNWPLLNDPQINAAMERAQRLLDRNARAEAWGKIDQQVTRTAAAVPWLWENWPTLFSKRVTPSTAKWNQGSPDVTFMAVK
jgi:ABC-type transport system substrate-binding protein